MEKVNEERLTEDLVLSRTFNAPLRRVWDAWTKPEYYKKWMGPEGYTIPYVDIDFREGGRSLVAMRGPDGKDIWSIGEYREIIPFKKIVSTDNFADEKGNIVQGDYYGMPGDWLNQLLVTVTFEEDGHGVKMTLVHSGLPGREHLDGAKTGWEQSLDKLERFLSDRNVQQK